MEEWRLRPDYKRANDGVLNHPIVEVKEIKKYWEACLVLAETGR